ncbi:MAG: ribonuclease III domain-containing protein [Candidatus Hodarchaeota archaeon]
MLEIRKEKVRKFQEFIDYKFNNEKLLVEALTTPRLGNELRKPNYEFLEILGDAVIKIIFILKLYSLGIKDPGTITKIKASLESDKSLRKVAHKMNLKEFVLKTEKQTVKGTRILADIFEAICGAIFLDSKNNYTIVEEKMINPFYTDLDSIIDDSVLNNKNVLLEFLQEKFKTSIVIKLEYKKGGYEHEPIWVAKNPQIIKKNTQELLINLPKDLKSNEFGNKKDAEKDIYLKILKYLKMRES